MASAADGAAIGDAAGDRGIATNNNTGTIAGSLYSTGVMKPAAYRTVVEESKTYKNTTTTDATAIGDIAINGRVVNQDALIPRLDSAAVGKSAGNGAAVTDRDSVAIYHSNLASVSDAVR